MACPAFGPVSAMTAVTATATSSSPIWMSASCAVVGVAFVRFETVVMKPPEAFGTAYWPVPELSGTQRLPASGTDPGGHPPLFMAATGLPVVVETQPPVVEVPGGVLNPDEPEELVRLESERTDRWADVQ